MIPAALLLASAAPHAAVEAERAFAAMAQTQGQWTAFRAYAADDGLMFVPEQVVAQQWLKGRADPPQPVMWWPAKAFISCDGNMAATTGPWIRSGGKLAGYFTSIWRRQPDGAWKWLLDHGDILPSARSAGDSVKVERASCARARPPAAPREETGSGRSADGSMMWTWKVEADGSRQVSVRLWDGQAYRTVITDKVAND